MNKKEYKKPELTVHGDIEKITLGGGIENSDVPKGPPGTAFPPGSP